MLECHPNNPLRPLHWRWLYARYLVAGEEPFQDTDGQVLHALEYLRQRRTDDVDAMANRTRSLEATHGAVELYEADPALPRWEVEARLLAGQTDEEIARKCALSPQAVERFHDLFFSVRHRLQVPGWIMIFAIGPKVYYGLREADQDVILKRFAYLHGPDALETLLGYYRTPFTLSDDIGELTVAERDRLVLNFEVRLAILSLCQLDEVAQRRYEALDRVRRDLQAHRVKAGDDWIGRTFGAQQLAQTMLAAVTFRADMLQPVELLERKALLPLPVITPPPLRACA